MFITGENLAHFDVCHITTRFIMLRADAQQPFYDLFSSTVGRPRSGNYKISMQSCLCACAYMCACVRHVLYISLDISFISMRTVPFLQYIVNLAPDCENLGRFNREHFTRNSNCLKLL